MGKGKTTPTTTVTQAGPSAAAQPYITDALSRARAISKQTYTPYTENRIAEFTPEQLAVQQTAAGLQMPTQFGNATDLTTQAGLGALNAAGYDPTSFSTNAVGVGALNDYLVGAPENLTTPTMTAAQGSYNPELQDYSMEGPASFSSEYAQQYMSPYVQNVLDVQKSQALRDAQQAQLAQNLGAARQGTYGGSRQLLATLGREATLGRQMADIEATGMQKAYEQALSQFNTEQGLIQNTRQQNLNAQLQTQALRTNTGLQMAMSNLSNEQQAAVQNQAAQLQTQGLNAENALKTALANQQSQLSTQQLGTQSKLQADLANQQAALDAQKASEQSRQFGAQQALNAYGQAAQAGQTLTNIGSAQSQAGLAQLNAQNTIAAQQQELEQKKLDQQYADFLAQRDWEKNQLAAYTSTIGALPLGTSQVATQYATAPSTASQVAGTGLAALGTYNSLRG